MEVIAVVSVPPRMMVYTFKFQKITKYKVLEESRYQKKDPINKRIHPNAYIIYMKAREFIVPKKSGIHYSNHSVN